jgi:hypothetical protein
MRNTPAPEGGVEAGLARAGPQWPTRADHQRSSFALQPPHQGGNRAGLIRGKGRDDKYQNGLRRKRRRPL